jgi:hypothetical protein
VARRVVWVKTPKENLANPAHFHAHVMSLGMHEDSKMLWGMMNSGRFWNVIKMESLAAGKKTTGYGTGQRELRLLRIWNERHWDKQRVIDLFSVMDWLMQLPE